MKRITLLFAFATSFALMANEIPAPQGTPPMPKAPISCPGPSALIGPTVKPGSFQPCHALILDPLVK